MPNQFLHTAPFVRIAFPLLLGSTFGQYLSPYFLALQGITLTIILSFLIVLRDKWKFPKHQVAFGILCFSFLFILGAFLSIISMDRLNKSINPLPNTEFVHARLLDVPKERNKSFSATAEIMGYYDGNDFHQGNGFRFVLYGNKFCGLDSMHYGDQLIFESRILPLRHTINPFQFDYATYLERKGIGGYCFVNEFKELSDRNHDFSLSRFFGKIQQKGVRAFRELGLSQSKTSIASALILGYRADLDSDTKADFADAGVIHILAVSGLHVGIIYIVLQWVLKYLFQRKKKAIQFILLLICIWFYAGLTGFSPSVLRAATMFSFIAIGSLGGKKGNTYNMLAASIILLVLVDPLIIREVGFQLSYLAVVGIVFLFDKISPLYWSKWWLIQKAWELLVVSFAAQIATAPLSIYYFGQFPNLFFISNLFVIPLATASLYAGLLFLIFSQVPVLGLAVGFVFKVVLTMLSSFVHLCSELPGAVTKNISLELHEVMLSYSVIIAFIVLVIRPSKKKSYLFASFFSILSLSIAVRHINASFKKELYVLEGKNCNLILLRNGKKAYIVPLTQNSSVNEVSNSYYFKDLLRKQLINEFIWVGQSDFLTSDIVKHELTIAYDNLVIGLNCIDKELNSSEALGILVLDKHFLMNDWPVNTNNRLYILDTSDSDKVNRKLKQIFPKARFWNLNEDGAFVLDLSDYSEINS